MSLPPPQLLQGDSAAADESDAFLSFVEHARSVLSSPDDRGLDGGGEPAADESGPSWSWTVSRILKTCIAYSSGVTSGILLSDLFQAWSEQHRYTTSKKRLECTIPLKKRHRRTRLPNTVTIDSIYEKNFLLPESVLEAVVVDAFLLPGTNIYMLNLGDFWSSYTIDVYLHRRYYHLVDEDNGILKKGREVLLTGCSLRSAMEGSGHPRILPTEYLVILLDEDQDEDAMLLGAQFCSDSFSAVSLNAAKAGTSYSFYARIESIGPLEAQGSFGCSQRKQITLVDNDGGKLKFTLWGEQVILSNLLSSGSMLAVDRPFIANITDSGIMTSQDVCLEYGSATQLYLVPFVQHEEQVLLASTQIMYQGTRLSSGASHSQGLKVSQVSLPLNSQGSVDFSNYPFRAYVNDLHDKMTGISLYAVVRNIKRETGTSETVFSVTIEDLTGAIVTKLHFVRSWSLGRLGLGHTIYISGLSCSLTTDKLLELAWFEKDSGTSLVDLSCLPAFLNSSCLHQLSCLSDLPKHITATNIFNVRLDQIELQHVHSVLCHSPCGRHMNDKSMGIVECSFCRCSSEGELLRGFHLKITLVDESAKIFAWCVGRTAAELLQVSPDEFFELPEDEQAMYLYTLQNERFMVAIVNTDQKNRPVLDQNNDPIWEIARAQRCE